MAPFRFRLERLLELHRRLEAQERQKLARARAEWAAAQDAVAGAEAVWASARLSLEQSLAGRVDVEGLLRCLAYHRHAGTALQAAQEAERAASARLAACQLKVQEARRARRMLELLRERQMARWQQEENRRQQREADDLFLSRWVRRSGRPEA